MPEITDLLDAAAGDRRAADQFVRHLYDELRRLAAAKIAAEAPGHTLDPTALVHEAYLRLIPNERFDGTAHFFAAAAEAMRRILVDHARAATGRSAAAAASGSSCSIRSIPSPKIPISSCRWMSC